MPPPYLSLLPEVESALQQGQPVVALESTIISHGMPYPQNVETALRVEAAVRVHGAVPATIAIMDGHLKAGLTTDEVERLGQSGLDTAKASRRDLPMLLAQNRIGATTVASTMIVADMAGIRVFATGGIGGVHRGGADTLDISADLQELARTSVAVVCAGAKAILDLPLTLEYLETHGVPVLGYQTAFLPAFYTRSSGLPLDEKLDSAAAIAQVLHTKWSLPLPGGVLVANPIPEAFSLDNTYMEALIQKALADADASNIKGKDVTPFLLARLEQLSGGSSLASNIELVLNNARLAAEIAVELAKIRNPH